MIATFLEVGIVCMESALFYYGYSDKTPLVWTEDTGADFACE